MEKHIKAANTFALLLDNKFELFGVHFGVGSIIDLIPGIGDGLDVLLSLYIVWIGIEINLPTLKIIRMFWNILFAFVVGLLPIIGDAAYILFKPNIRNVKILKEFHG